TRKRSLWVMRYGPSGRARTALPFTFGKWGVKLRPPQITQLATLAAAPGGAADGWAGFACMDGSTWVACIDRDLGSDAGDPRTQKMCVLRETDHGFVFQRAGEERLDETHGFGPRREQV